MKGGAVQTALNAAVKVGGNVKSENTAVSAGEGCIVLVEGVVTGDVHSEASGAVYIGELKGNIDSDASKSSIHYLIGTVDGSDIRSKLSIEDPEGCIATAGQYGTDGNKIYRYTKTADVSGKSLILKSLDSNKKLDIEGIAASAGVTLVPNADGSVKLTFGTNFKGGLQDLMLIFSDIIVKNSSTGGGSSKPIFTGNKSNPVTNGKWTQNADGTWSYATSRKFTNTWGYIANPNDAASAAWYYFDGNGNMLTGWQEIFWNGAKTWFYFIEAKGAEEGKCLINGITPDGYRVGPDGAWIEG